MSKQRLIDGNELYGIESLLNTDIVQNSKEASWLMSQVLHDIQASPTIDPEALPIVRQLREENARLNRGISNLAENVKSAYEQRDKIQKELSQVTAERDAAVERVQHYARCWECDKRDKGECAMPFYKDDCDNWSWRGAQKEG